MMDRALDHGTFDRRDLQTLRLAYNLGRDILGASGIFGPVADTDLAKLIFEIAHNAKMAGGGLKNRDMAGPLAVQACATLAARQPLALCA